MRVEHLKRWISTARKDKTEKKKAEKEEATTTERAGGTEKGEVSAVQKETETDNWTSVMDLIPSMFWDWNLAEESTWQAVVLVPKGKKEYRGVCLVEVMWKVVAEILNCRLTASITYHDFLHGFWEGRG